MERKTRLQAEDDRQEIIITREFDLPVALLFKAYIEPEIVAQWMGTKVLLLENKPHGSYRFETSGPQGNVVVRIHGVIHEFIPEQKITRTFEMDGSSFPVQLEFLDFEKLTEDKSKLTMHMIFRSVASRNQMLKLPFAQGISMAHDRLEAVVRQSC